MFETLLFEMKQRNFSQNSMKSYLYHNLQFLEYSKKEPHKITQKDIQRYITHLIGRGVKTSSLTTVNEAIKFYYTHVMGRHLIKPKETSLERIDILKLFAVLRSPKHKLLLSLLYETNIPASKIIKLKKIDINFDQKYVTIDTEVFIVSEKVSQDLQQFILNNMSQNEFIFDTIDGHFSQRTVINILKQAARKARIEREITPDLLQKSWKQHIEAIV